MAQFTAKDVQALRQATGAGMMDAKKALEAADGDMEEAKQALREKGLAKADSRGDRENRDGAVALATTDDAVALVELKCETDFVAKSEAFTQLAQTLADAVVRDGTSAVDGHKDAVDDLRVTLKENIEIGETARVEVQPGQMLDTYLHRQEGRGVNGVVVVLQGGTAELAHDLAIHIAFAKPGYLRRDDVPVDEVEEERQTLTKITQAEGKPESALPKIVEGKLNGWFKRQPGGVLLDQPFVRDDKQTVSKLLSGAGADVVSFAQIVVGG
jgi:elongation factor Ts